MAGPADLYTGAIASEERWRARRAEARQAFMEFMKMYPNASADDYRRYAYDVTEGNSYLRGALPTDEIMNRLATDRQSEYAQQRMASQLSLLQSQAQIAGQLDVLASNYALDTDDDNKVIEQVATAIGYNARDPNTQSILDQVKRQYASGFNAIRQRQRDEIFSKNLPTVERLIQANPNLTDQEMITLVPGLDPNMSGPRQKIVLEMLKGARTKEGERQEALKRERLDKVVRDAQEQIKTVGEYSLPGLEGAELAEAERRVKPFYDAQKKLVTDEKRQRSNTILTNAASIYANDPAYLSSLAEDANKLPALKEYLRRSAQTNGIEADDAQIDFIANSLMDKAKVALRDKNIVKEKAKYDDFEQRLSITLADPTAKVNAFPSVPTFSDPTMQAKAKEIYDSAVMRWATRDAEVRRKEDLAATGLTLDGLMKDELFIQQVIMGDASPEKINARVADEMRIHLGRDPTPEDVKSVLSRLGQRTDSIASSRLVQQSAALKEQVKTMSTTATDNNKKALVALINQRTGNTDEAQTESGVALNVVVQSLLFSPDSGRVLTPDGVAALAPFMTREFAEEHGNDPQQIYEAINKAVGNRLDVSSSSEAERAIRAAFPYGDRRGSKKLFTETQPQQVVVKLGEIDKRLQESYAKLTATIGQARREQVRHPGSFSTSQTTEATAAFQAEIEELQRGAKALAGQAINQIQNAAAKSEFWSSDGPITDEEIRKTREMVAARLKATLSRIDAIKKNSDSIVVNLGVSPEDQLIGESPRLQSTNEDVKTRFKNSPVGQMLDYIGTNDRPLEADQGLSPGGRIDYQQLRRQFQE